MVVDSDPHAPASRMGLLRLASVRKAFVSRGRAPAGLARVPSLAEAHMALCEREPLRARIDLPIRLLSACDRFAASFPGDNRRDLPEPARWHRHSCRCRLDVLIEPNLRMSEYGSTEL